MYSLVKTCVLIGLDGYLIDVETDLSKGIPSFNIVGLPDTAIKESKERVRSAIKNSGFKFPISRITVNLAPANLKKEGSQIDLSIAIGILKASGLLNKNLENFCFIGELSLNGSLNKIKGVLPLVLAIRNRGIKNIIIPYDNKEECSMIEDINIFPIKSLFEVFYFLNGKEKINPYVKVNKDINLNLEYTEDFSDISGQQGLKRAIEVAAAGAHNILILGPPGSGKTMIARRIPTILPDLTFKEALEITKIYSVSGLLKDNAIVTSRPFRSPHHTTSKVSIVGGGRNPIPGEVTLAHYGVLFLDELPEFSKSVIEVLREPLEDGIITISRAYGKVTYPSKFMLVASMNPCPCGYYGDPYHECSCSSNKIEKYLAKISGPLLDRIDIHIEASPVKYTDLSKNVKNETSKDIKDRVNRARQIQLKRYENLEIFTNSELKNDLIKKFCKLNKECDKILETAFEKLKLSARAYSKILKLSRTIADLDNSENINPSHILEALQYRNLDKKYWS